MCDIMSHRLTKIDSGHSVCDSCLQEFRTEAVPDSSEFQWKRASPYQVTTLRRYGFDVAETATILDCWKYNQILLRRRLGFADDMSFDELYRRLLEYGLSHDGKWDWYCETYVAGGHHQNPDGTIRLEMLRQCRVGENLKLVREPENIHQGDLRAIKVCRESGGQLGYIPAHLLGNDKRLGYCIADEMDSGDLFRAVLATISAKCRDGVSEFGLNDGDIIGDVIASCERQRGMRFDASTVTARIEVYRFDSTYPQIEIPIAPSATEVKALQVRINKLRKLGVELPSGATIADCWEQEQILLRRRLKLPDDASQQ